MGTKVRGLSLYMWFFNAVHERDTESLRRSLDIEGGGGSVMRSLGCALTVVGLRLSDFDTGYSLVGVNVLPSIILSVIRVYIRSSGIEF